MSIQRSNVKATADHLREQFECLNHRRELAKDLGCFRAGGKLSNIRYVAHAHGLHVVSSWLRVLAHTQAKVHIDTANPLRAFENDFVSCRPLLPKWLRAPMIVRHFLAGLVLRYSPSKRSQTPIHAHGAAGNGLTAWMSGQPYSIITYGSEIYCAKERGIIYCWLLKRILRGAERFFIGSDDGVRVLQDQFGIPAKDIYMFHLGYNECFSPLDHSGRMALRAERQLPHNEPIWVINRRTHPHYRTLEVVSGFLDHCRDGGSGRLVLICGDDQVNYTESILDMCGKHENGDRVRFVKGILTQPEIVPWLQLADFSISAPKSDNMSISILESLGCGTSPILADIEGFAPMKACPTVCWMSDCEPSHFRDMFSRTSKFSHTVNADRRQACLRFVRSWCPPEAVIRDVAAFCLGEPLRDSMGVRRAA